MKERKAGTSIFALVLESVIFFTLSGFDYSRNSIPLDDISDGGLGPVKDVFNKVPIQIHFDHKAQTAIIRNSKKGRAASGSRVLVCLVRVSPNNKSFYCGTEIIQREIVQIINRL
jgi:hypothetical protein